MKDKFEGFSFELEDKNRPREVVASLLSEFEKQSRGYVMCNIEQYNGDLKEYTYYPLDPLRSAFSERKKSPKDDLGNCEGEIFKFEIFLTAKLLPNYKYRIFFMRYDELSYPVDLIVDEAIMSTIKGDPYFVREKNQKELKEFVLQILYSEQVIELVQGLIYESLRIENEAKK